MLKIRLKYLGSCIGTGTVYDMKQKSVLYLSCSAEVCAANQ